MRESVAPTDRSESERRFRDLFNNAPVGYHEVDKDGRYVRVNRTEASMLGYEPEEMVGRYVWDFVVEDVSKSAFAAKIAGMMELAAFERTFKRKDGSVFPVLLEERLIHDASGKPCGIRTTVFDITRRKQTEEALKDSEERYRRLVELSPDGIIVHDNHKISFVNSAAVRMLGAERPGDLVGRHVMDFVHADSQAPERRRHRNLKRDRGEPRLQERRFVRLDGTPVDVEAAAIPFDAQDGTLVQLVLRDITERKLMEQQIRALAYHDALTGLPNRILLHDRAGVALAQARRHGFLVGVCFIDLDGFKEVNDTLGHAFGDRLLVAVAGRIGEGIREGDTLARLGGDEFTLVLPNLTRIEDAIPAADKALTALRQPFELEGHQLKVTASIGVSIFPHDGTDVETLLQRADSAMYRAKDQGRDRTVVYSDPDQDPSAPSRL